jgi:NADPH2:quinone reductase
VQALVFDRFGGPEVLSLRDVPAPALEPGTALVRMKAVGLNFADVYRRRGNYHLVGEPPYILGYEGSGVIEAIDATSAGGGSSSSGAGAVAPSLRVGDRVAFADVPHANAEIVRAPLTHLVPLPESVSFQLAAASMLQGLTAQYLVRDSHAVKPGERAIVHAAAGGVGLLLVQMIALAGGVPIALASSDEKLALARAKGAVHAFRYDEDWVRKAGGADVAYDSVGETLGKSLEAVRIGGHVVFYGMAGGDPAPVDPRKLMDGSKTLTGGDLWNVLTTSEARRNRSAELFALIAEKKLDVTIAAEFPLARGADAHREIESRKTMGKILLIP